MAKTKKRRPKESEPSRTLKRFSDQITDEFSRLTYWWNQLHPGRRETVGVQIIHEHGVVLPVKSSNAIPNLEEVKTYLIAECGLTGSHVDEMTLSEVVGVLSKIVESKSPKKKLNGAQQRILCALKPGETLKGAAIARRVDRSEDYVRRVLSRLVKAGHLEKCTGEGYRRCRRCDDL